MKKLFLILFLLISVIPYQSEGQITSSSVDKVTISTIPRTVRKLPSAVEMDIYIFNNNQNLKISVIKWRIFFYQIVLSNPRFVNINTLFSANYIQLIDIFEPGRANLFLIAKTINVPDIPIGGTSLATLKFDRVFYANPVSYGVDGLNSFVIGIVEIPSQISLF